jgi:hypothetical protein
MIKIQLYVRKIVEVISYGVVGLCIVTVFFLIVTIGIFLDWIDEGDSGEK